MEDDKKERIREAAIKVMAETGFFNTKTSSVAEEAGVAVGTIYNYFRSKDEILEYIFAVELKKRLTILNRLRESTEGFWGKLDRFLSYHFQEIIKQPEIGRILVREKEYPRKNGATQISGYLQKIPEAIELMLNEAMERGEIGKHKAKVVAAIIFGAVQGVVEKTVNTDDFSLLTTAAQDLVELLKKGL
ncbi:MAG TPA: hypothetical protein DDW93_12330 [Firmicutes bacterium]|mgnify:FL=1|jgi:TetR/AcrR family fatty acid metabolism transcriptional regulator|nr:hypothetical protein [Bacillota bacterium]HBT17384.1 hypothetical protein [Bacillota bacterium]